MIQAETTVEHRTDADFETELIDRFFNPKSYFLNRFLNVLREKETKNSDPVQMVAVGLIVDQIIASEDKQRIMADLDRFPAFRRYHEQLQSGIQFLKNGRLTTQQMMDIVGALGTSLAEALLEIVQDEESRDGLLEMAGVAPEKPPVPAQEAAAEAAETPSEHVPAAELPEWAAELQPEPAKEEEIPEPEEAPWSFFKSDIDEKLHLLEKHLEHFARHPHDWAVFRKIKDDFRDLRDWSMIQGEEGIEAISHKILRLFEAVYARGPEHRARILPILYDALETMKAVNQAGRKGERLDIVRVMVHQIERQRRIYPERLEESRDSAEPPAPPAPERPAPVSEPENGTAADSAEPPRDTAGVQEPPAVQEPFPSGEETELITSEAELEEPPPKEQAAAEPETPAGAEEDLSLSGDLGAIRESELLSELVSEHGDELAELELPELEEISEELRKSVPPAEKSREELRLPGEDDEELLTILSELKEEQAPAAPAHPDKEPKLEIPDDASRFDEHLERLENTYAREIAAESGEQLPAEPPAPQNGSGNVPSTAEPEGAGGKEPGSSSGGGQDFVSEADMYFTFGRKALQSLMKNPEERQALEDLELAAYSLKILAERLNYLEIARAFGLTEQLVQNRIESRVGLKPEQVNALVTLLHEVEQAGRERKLADPARQRWLQKQVDLLKSWVGSAAAQKEPPHAEGSPKQTKGSEDPLDFLLFDDTSKFFKNLLSE